MEATIDANKNMEDSEKRQDVDEMSQDMHSHTTQGESEDGSSDGSRYLSDSNLHYEAQFFGFTPMSFSDGVYNALQLYSWELLEQAQLTIQREFHDLVSSEDTNKASQAIMMKMTKCFERAFDKLELYLTSHIFRIPKNVVLPEDEKQEEYPDAEQTSDELDEEIRELKAKIKEAKIKNANLKAEIADISTVQAELDKTLAYINDLSKIISPEQCESLRYVCNKAVQLKNVFERLEGSPDAKKQRIEES